LELIGNRDGRSLLFLTPTSLLLLQIQLRLQSSSEKFSNIILRLHFYSEIFKVWETNSDVKITFHGLNPRVYYSRLLLLQLWLNSIFALIYVLLPSKKNEMIMANVLLLPLPHICTYFSLQPM